LSDIDPKRYQNRVALYGLGGVGKTQIALQYCYNYRTAYRQVFWISGVDRTALFNGFREIATFTGCADVGVHQSPDEITTNVLKWLSTEGNWLLVIDNVDDVTVVEGFLPKVDAGGHILFTTRTTDSYEISTEGLEVVVMSVTESTELLLTRSALKGDTTPDVHEAARDIVNELDHLPLAIEQAAAFIRDSQDISQFLATYRKNRSRLLSRRAHGINSYRDSVATTWKLSFERVKAINPTFVEFLQLLAFLNPDGTLVEFLKEGKEGLNQGMQVLVGDAIEFTDALAALQRFSLIRV
jgi:NB-ARC domain